MSTLTAFSLMIGKAMNLPPVFYKKLPLPSILETPLTRSSTKRRTYRSRRVSSQRVANGSTALDQTSARQNGVLVGELNNGTSTRYSINGEDFSISSTTFIVGDLKVGISVRVKGVRDLDGLLEALSIVAV